VYDLISPNICDLRMKLLVQRIYHIPKNMKGINDYRCIWINVITCRSSWLILRDLWEGPQRMKLRLVNGPKLDPLI